jgi:DNA-binding NarL/FixJ family response regulator
VSRTRLLIVDDHEVVREGLMAALARTARYEVVASAGYGREALEQAKITLPDVAIVDLRLPDMGGEEVTRELRQLQPRIAVIILTTYLGEGTVRATLEAGASGYVTKAAGLPALRAAIDGAVAVDGPAGKAPAQIVSQLHKLAASRFGDTIPTPRQESVLELAAQGLTNGEIGDQLFISESTVRFHIQKLKQKFTARTKAELVAKAVRVGFIAPAAEDGIPKVPQ